MVLASERPGLTIDQLKAAADVDFYDIKTATPIRLDQFKNEKMLWERAGPSASVASDGNSPSPKGQSEKKFSIRFARRPPPAASRQPPAASPVSPAKASARAASTNTVFTETWLPPRVLA